MTIAPPPRELAPPTNALAVAGFVLGMITLGLVLLDTALLILLVPAVLALVFGFIGINTANRLGGKRRALAIIGVILGFAPLWFPFGFSVVTGTTY